MFKSKLLLVAILPGVLLGLIALWLFMTKPKIGELAQTILPQDGADNVAIAAATATLYRESGDIQYKDANGTFVSVSEDETTIVSGTAVKTIDGLGHVIFPDNSMMSLDQNTEVVVTFNETSMNVTQLLGKTFHRVEQVLQGHTYEVETPTTLATVRGTEFGVTLAQDLSSSVFVTESVVDVSSITKIGGERIIKATEKVQAGNQAEVPVGSDVLPNVKPIPAAVKNDPWVKRNEEVSKKIKEEETRPKDPSVGTQPEQKIPLKVLKEEVKNDPIIKKLDLEAKKADLGNPSVQNKQNNDNFTNGVNNQQLQNAGGTKTGNTPAKIEQNAPTKTQLSNPPPPPAQGIIKDETTTAPKVEPKQSQAPVINTPLKTEEVKGTTTVTETKQVQPKVEEAPKNVQTAPKLNLY